MLLWFTHDLKCFSRNRETIPDSTFADYIQVISGDVSVVDGKIRGLSHFPSFRLKNLSLQRMTGRWFYEVTLLSDGLMQIGFANSLFRCDPVCGQGVGDHFHSWAYDGLRNKKWVISSQKVMIVL